MMEENMNRQRSESRLELASFWTRRDGVGPSVNKWSVVINIALTTISAILSALGYGIG